MEYFFLHIACYRAHFRSLSEYRHIQIRAKEKAPAQQNFNSSALGLLAFLRLFAILAQCF